MKTALVFVAIVVLASVVALGQGQFLFNNRVPPDIDARFVLCTDQPGTSSVTGDAFHAEVFAGPAGTVVDSEHFTEHLITDFRTGLAAGYVNATTATVPGAFFGIIPVLVRAFNGPSWEAATFKFEGRFTARVDTAPGPPGPIYMGTSPLVLCTVPEPHPLLLGLIGFGLMLWMAGDNDRMEANCCSASYFRPCHGHLEDYGENMSSSPTAVGHADLLAA